ncbi:hypothetical protein M501DRAFT_985636 [Patellaria atrata CBS 101060]|uniref:Uncharacterized protein n=1 Tax=Patellaria atrata CBS 101060 TaxID=1346257 RepID=A0A9P4SJQ5_9PEZI|nr:hypothetical protein M501DRAFT_985636 [Patellaria atrata CBS 101060]
MSDTRDFAYSSLHPPTRTLSDLFDEIELMCMSCTLPFPLNWHRRHNFPLQWTDLQIVGVLLHGLRKLRGKVVRKIEWKPDFLDTNIVGPYSGDMILLHLDESEVQESNAERSPNVYMIPINAEWQVANEIQNLRNMNRESRFDIIGPLRESNAPMIAEMYSLGFQNLLQDLDVVPLIVKDTYPAYEPGREDTLVGRRSPGGIIQYIDIGRAIEAWNYYGTMVLDPQNWQVLSDCALSHGWCSLGIQEDWRQRFSTALNEEAEFYSLRHQWKSAKLIKDKEAMRRIKSEQRKLYLNTFYKCREQALFQVVEPLLADEDKKIKELESANAVLEAQKLILNNETCTVEVLMQGYEASQKQARAVIDQLEYIETQVEGMDSLLDYSKTRVRKIGTRINRLTARDIRESETRIEEIAKRLSTSETISFIAKISDDLDTITEITSAMDERLTSVDEGLKSAMDQTSAHYGVVEECLVFVDAMSEESTKLANRLTSLNIIDNHPSRNPSPPSSDITTFSHFIHRKAQRAQDGTLLPSDEY